jgi:hypothetical protein
VSRGLLEWVLPWQLVLLITPTAAAFNASNAADLNEYRQVVEQALQRAQSAAQLPTPTLDALVKLAQAYLDAGDDLYTDPRQQHGAYEKGAGAALQAIAMNERNADAHFLYAANLGSAVRLSGHDPRALLELRTIKHHVTRAIELDPAHARALQFLGGLLAELPWVLGGREDEAERFLKQAIQVDSNYTNARLLLAKLYVKQDRTEEAKEQLAALLHTPHPYYPFHWRHHFKPEAERLLQSLERSSR